MTYVGAGVDYGALDQFKRAAQKAGLETAKNLNRLGLQEVEGSRGESVYLIETPNRFLGHVEEGLGTKNLVADEIYRLTGKSYYGQIAQDAVAMIVNDAITLGVFPCSLLMHLAVGDSSWFDDTKRWQDLIGGWKKGCMLARCAWGGGETPALKGIIAPNTFFLGGSALGTRPKSQFIQGNIQHGDAIIFIESSGIHANGLTLCRQIAERKNSFWRKVAHFFFPRFVQRNALPNGYLTKLADGRAYGETLLEPTYIYVPIIEDCLNYKIDVHYAVNITGHGWRKLMRAKENFSYVIEELPRQQLIFDFIQKHGPVDEEEMYANFNMGAGFALYLPEAEVEKILKIIASCGSFGQFIAFRAGHIEKGNDKKVVIKPKNITFSGDTLKVR